MTDGQIEELIAIPKLLPKSKWFSMREEFGYMRLDVSLESDSKYRFFLKGRCSLVNPVDFSAILTVKLPLGRISEPYQMQRASLPQEYDGKGTAWGCLPPP